MTLKTLFKNLICQIGSSQRKCCSKVIQIKEMDQPIPLFNSVLNILSFLEKPENNCHEVQELINIYQEKDKQRMVLECRKFPLIILEGLDGCGKTSVGKRLAAKNGAIQWKTPPDSIKHLRHFFDETLHLRTAYYCLGNYVAAIEVLDLLKDRPVVMDRFWHSTAAYAIAQAVDDYPDKHKMPPSNDNIFCWPGDLLKPDIVIFLNVSESVRKQRQSRRTNVTKQEDLLNNSEKFRADVIQAYKNMHNPGVVFIDSNLPFKQTLALIGEQTKHLFQE